MGSDEAVKLKSVHVDLPKDVHQRLKVLVAIKEVTLKDYALAAILEKMDRDGKEMRK